MTIKRLEDLECWQEARKLVNMIYAAVKSNPEFQKDFRLVSQFTAAGISVMNEPNVPNDLNDLNHSTKIS